MKYKNITEGVFIDRPNRFIANVEIDGELHSCHVKNTGRCKELFVKGATVYLEASDNPNRKTLYDVVAVKKGSRLVNIDSQIVNYAVLEYLPQLFPKLKYSRTEYKYGNSRFDIYAESGQDRIFLEVKGVTLERDGTAIFPDAPTARGVKHLQELQKALREGYRAFAVFVVQMSGVTHFEPNRITHPQFADELIRAQKNGVTVLAFDCTVAPDEIKIDKPIPVRL